MKLNTVVIRRSAAKMWLLGVAGVPLLILVVEYVWGSFGFIDKLGTWAYRGGDVEAFEIKDDILMAALAILGVSLVVISIKELLLPRKLIIATDKGMRFALDGPFKPLTFASWLQITDLVADKKALLVLLDHRGTLPEDPWGAKWLDQSTLRIPSNLWEKRPAKFINEIALLGLPNAVREQALNEELLAGFQELEEVAILGEPESPSEQTPISLASDEDLSPVDEPLPTPEIEASPDQEDA